MEPTIPISQLVSGRGNVADLYLYDNVTALLKVTGAQIKEWLEMSAGQFNQIDLTAEPQQLINSSCQQYSTMWLMVDL